MDTPNLKNNSRNDIISGGRAVSPPSPTNFASENTVFSSTTTLRAARQADNNSQFDPEILPDTLSDLDIDQQGAETLNQPLNTNKRTALIETQPPDTNAHATPEVATQLPERNPPETNQKKL